MIPDPKNVILVPRNPHPGARGGRFNTYNSLVTWRKGSIFTQGSASKKSSIALVPLTFRPSSSDLRFFHLGKKPSQKLQQKCIAQRVLPPFPSRGSSPSKGWKFWQHRKIREIFGGDGCKDMHSGLIIIYLGESNYAHSADFLIEKKLQTGSLHCRPKNAPWFREILQIYINLPCVCIVSWAS